MKLVYLDTNVLSLLSETYQNLPDRFHFFLKTWNEQKYILALSEANIFEIARKGFNESRYNLLKKLCPIRFESHIFLKEIMSFFKPKGIRNLLIKNYDFCKPMFSEVIYSSQRLRYLCNPTSGDYSTLTDQSYELSEISWESKKHHPIDKNKRKFRLGDLQDLQPDEFKNYLEDVVDFLERDGLSHPGINQVKFLHSRINEVGCKQAFAELMRIDMNNERNLNKPLDPLFDQSLFNISVQSALSRLLYEKANTIELLARKISIEDCPGEWLKRKVEHQLHKSADFETNNELDIRHISHLPYVDILITDKRIVDKTNQVFNSKDLIDSLKSVSLPKRFSNSMESLEKTLFI